MTSLPVATLPNTKNRPPLFPRTDGKLRSTPSLCYPKSNSLARCLSDKMRVNPAIDGVSDITDCIS